MEIDLPIDCDLPCVECGYNLRTRRANQICPECGTDVLNSVRATTRGFPELAGIRREISRERFRPAAEAAGCTIDAMMFVSDGLRPAMSVAQGARQNPRHVSPAQVCAAVRAQAQDYFNDEAEAIDLLNEWGIRSSEDVGRIIFAMVDAKLVQTQKGDSIAQFNGLLTLDNLF